MVSCTDLRAWFAAPVGCAVLLFGAVPAMSAAAAPTPGVAAELASATTSAGGPATAGDAVVPAEDVLMEVSVQPQSSYVRARLRYRVRVLASVPLREATLSEPSAEGAWIRRLGADNRFDTRRDGREYRVIERLYVVVPQRTGPLTIEAPTLTAAVPLRALENRERADSLLDRRVVISRRPQPLTFTVQPPPADAQRPWLPAESVSITEHWEPEPENVRPGEPIRRRIVVEASGAAFGAIALPEPPEIAGLQVYAQPSKQEEQLLGDDLGLRVEQTLTLVPTVSGMIRVPEVSIPWWSLGMDEQRQARVPGRDLLVADAPESAAAHSDDDHAIRQRFIGRAADDPWGAEELALLLGFGWAVTLALLLRERRRRNRASAAGGYRELRASEPSEQALIDGFRRACARNDARAARDALNTWARLYAHAGPNGHGLAAALRDRGVDDEVIELLRTLDRCAYGVREDRAMPEGRPPMVPGTWEGAEALRILAPLLERKAAAGEAAENRLAELYPQPRPNGRKR